MAILRNRDSLQTAAPPPSPIPTAKGSRSAAIDDQILSQYLERSLQIPDLTLPESSFTEIRHHRVPAVIDLRLLISGDEDSIHQLLGSAMEFGVFRLKGHGISVEELRETMAEADWVFLISAEKKKDLTRYFGRQRGNREVFFWFYNETARSELLQEEIGCERYRSFSQKMENVTRRLEAISEKLCQVLSQTRLERKQSSKRIQEEEPVLCLCRYSDHILTDQNSPYDDRKTRDSSHYALSFHLSVGHCEFQSQSKQHPSSFNITSDTIVVTLGRKLEEWSNGKFKCVHGELVLGPSIDGSPSYSLEFMCSPSTLNYKKIISLADQMLIAFTIAFSYSFFLYISSRFRGT